MRYAAVFPGQGSQCVGMGCDVAASSPAARALFDRAAVVLGYDLLELQRVGPEERLRETEFSQPAIFTTNLALFEAAGGVEPVVTAGHSFAELCSLVIARSLSFEDALRIVGARAKAMQAAAQRARGGMSAVLGLDAQQVRDVLQRVADEIGGRVALANFNSPTQIVISGDLQAVQAATQPMLDAGAKRVVPLNVSGAWHSVLMEFAVEPLAAAVETASFAMPQFDVISNVDGRPYRDAATIKSQLVRSVVEEVRWHDTALRLLTYDLNRVVEFGASNVLGALMKRTPGAPPVSVVADFGGAQKFRAELERAAGAAV
ncbi:MAG TPA: ACP S-malonyltransferase [Candidatus Cybelea sp.]|nr:ACP S-malonyltransferase [Candidatus Cybelea sp.]